MHVRIVEVVSLCRVKIINSKPIWIITRFIPSSNHNQVTVAVEIE